MRKLGAARAMIAVEHRARMSHDLDVTDFIALELVDKMARLARFIGRGVWAGATTVYELAASRVRSRR